MLRSIARPGLRIIARFVGVVGLVPGATRADANGLTDPTLFHLVADVNGDGSVNNADLQALLSLLKSGDGSAEPIPEPTTLVLAALGGLALLACRRRFRFIVAGAALIILATTAVPPAAANVYSWTGNGFLPPSFDGYDWSNSYNWQSNSIAQPDVTTIIDFLSAPTGLSINNLGSFTLNELVLDTPVVLTGNPLSFQSDQSSGTVKPVINLRSPGPVTIQNDLSLGDDFEILGNGTGPLTLAGAISGNHLIYVEAYGSTVLANGGNSYSGTFVFESTLRTDAAGALPAGKSVSIVSGTLNLNGTNQSISTLSLGNPSYDARVPLVQTGNGTLTLGGDVTYSPASGLTQGSMITGNLSLGVATRTFNIGSGASDTGYDTLVSAQITGNGGLTKTGAGLLALSSGSNAYTGNTVIQSGTLRTDTSGALPAGRDVTVQNGTLNLNGTSQSIGSLTLSDPTANNFSSSLLQIGSAGTLTLGGNVAFNPPSNAFSAITGGTLDLGAAVRTFNIGVGGADYDTVIGATIASGGLTKTGNGSLALAQRATYTGPTTVSSGTLYLGVSNAISPTSVVVNGGTLSLAPGVTIQGVTAGSYNQSFGSLAGSGGSVDLGTATLTVGTDNTSTSYAGNLVGTYNTATGTSGTLVKVGTGTFTLSGNNANSYFGSVTVNGGILAISSDGTLGAASNVITVNTAGTLRYTANVGTGRTFSLNGGTLEAASGATVTLNGATVAGGFLRGAGAFALTGNTALYGVSTPTSTTINQTGPASVTNFTNNGQFNVATVQTLNWSNGTVTSAGRLTVAGTVAASDFISNGVVTINAGGAIINTGSNLVLGGGSRTTINASGLLSTASGATIELNGGLLVNNGTITGTTDVNFGSLAKGTGAYGAVNVSQGGMFAPGNSPGIATAAAVSFDNTPVSSGAPTLQIELGGTTAGAQYDRLQVAGQLSLGGVLNVVLYNGFKPVAGNSFDILDWGTRSGTFDTVDLPALGGRIVWDSSHLYDRGALGGTLSVANTYYAGDFNRDGHVNAADLLPMMKALADLPSFEIANGLTDPTLFHLVADVNGDGSVNNADLQALLSLLKSGDGSAEPIPEPTTLVLAALGGLALLACRRRLFSRIGLSDAHWRTNSPPHECDEL